MFISDIYDKFLKCSCVTIDSRNIPEHSMFFALKGASFDGNDFALDALTKGASYIVIDNEKYYDKRNSKIILVEDVLTTLQKLAQHHRLALQTKIIAITGTNGKTTSKELIATVLQQKYNVLYTQGNLNNHIGVPLTLLSLKKEHEIAVVEMGANHIGEIAFLANLVQPDFGLITNIGKAHLEGFGDLNGVIKTKGELFDYLRTKPESCIFLNADDPILCEISHDLFSFKYSKSKDSAIQGRITKNSPYISVEWKDRKSLTYQIDTQLIGEYNLYNILAAITIGDVYNVPHNLINQSISNYSPNNNRSQLSKTEKNTLIVDAYNANPTSMKVAINNFHEMDMPNKFLILGDMNELGPTSVIEHQNIVNLLESYDFKNVILVGNEFNKVNHNYQSFSDISVLSQYLEVNPLEEKTILIKGSNSIKLFMLPKLL